MPAAIPPPDTHHREQRVCRSHSGLKAATKTPKEAEAGAGGLDAAETFALTKTCPCAASCFQMLITALV